MAKYLKTGVGKAELKAAEAKVRQVVEGILA